MLNSIRAKLILAVIVMAALLGGLIFFTSAQMTSVQDTLTDMENLQDIKTHVMAPQKDMNQFIAAMDSTVLFLELGDADGAQGAFDGSVDAEQDISGEFEYLEASATGDLQPMLAQAHLDWEIAMEFMKIKAEVLADEKGIDLARPSTEPTKVVDAHVGEAAATAQDEYAGLSFDELTAIADNNEISPIEVADEAIDTSDELTTELLEAERADGEQAIENSSRTVLFGSVAVLLAIILIGAFVTASVSRPLSMLKAGAEKIAEGDLGYEFKNVPADEIGSVIHSVETMASGLKNRIRTLEEVAGVVMITGDEIGSAASAAKSSGADVDEIIAKAEQLKSLIGPVLEQTKK
jgi:methyl-accepting chemotaxis protein